MLKSDYLNATSGSLGTKTPNAILPMLLSTSKTPFEDENYIFEFKFDGVRMVAYIFENIKLINRRLKEKSSLYPELVNELNNIPKGTVLDGEIIALDKNGNQSFYKVLERDLTKRYNPKNSIPIMYMVFDVLYFDYKCIMNIPLFERKSILKTIFKNGYTFMQRTEHYPKIGNTLFSVAQKMNLEGIVAKKACSIYKEGTRSTDWLKIKAIKRTNAFVGGYIQKSRPSLCLGIPLENNKKLRYIGNVGNGLNEKEWINLKRRLESLETNVNPFEDFKSKETIFISPHFEVCVEYLEINENGTLRQPIIAKIY